jgi:hypothetical protein
MQINLKSFLFGLSVFVNCLFILLFVFASVSSSDRKNISFEAPDGYITGATIISVPSGAMAVFSPVEVSMKTREKIVIQYSFFASNKQGNMLINAIYDPDIISVSYTGAVIEIYARSAGTTMMQDLTVDGIMDVALITVYEE